MALEPCRECGHDVSTEAEACPSCGVPDPTDDPDEYDWSAIDYQPPEDDGGLFSSGSSSSSSSRPSGKIVVENPENGYRKSIRHAGIKTLLTGSLYFLAHSMVSRAIFGFIVGWLTVGLGWLYVAYKAESYITDYYQSEGWELVSS